MLGSSSDESEAAGPYRRAGQGVVNGVCRQTALWEADRDGQTSERGLLFPHHEAERGAGELVGLTQLILQISEI